MSDTWGQHWTALFFIFRIRRGLILRKDWIKSLWVRSWMNESFTDLKQLEAELVCDLFPDLLVYPIMYLFHYHNSSIFIPTFSLPTAPNCFSKPKSQKEWDIMLSTYHFATLFWLEINTYFSSIIFVKRKCILFCYFRIIFLNMN